MSAIAAGAGFMTLPAFLQPIPASTDEAKYYLDCPTAVVREGESVQANGPEGPILALQL